MLYNLVVVPTFRVNLLLPSSGHRTIFNEVFTFFYKVGYALIF
jgi:hypothetical protein